MIAFNDFDLRRGPAEGSGTVGEPFLDVITFAVVPDLSGTALADVDGGQSLLVLWLDFFRHDFSPRQVLVPRQRMNMFAVRVTVPTARTGLLAGLVAGRVATIPTWATRRETAGVAATMIGGPWLPP